ncbi:MAG TPA: Clp protease N-terminal domain-containing protein [Acidimicrobiales bacterium]|nr:Clp protease N-terminal domain-containing protein [Acidimicrobiales bacterium]
MFERLTGEARDVVVRAQEHARQLGHAWTGCEHLLLAVAASATPAGEMVRDRGNLAELERAIRAMVGQGGDANDAALLAKLGIDLEQVRRAAETTFGAGALEAVGARRRRGHWSGLRRRRCPSQPSTPPLTPKAKRCLELSLREALRRNHNYLGVEHIALALLARDDTAAWAVLRELGVVPGELQRTIDDSLRRTA